MRLAVRAVSGRRAEVGARTYTVQCRRLPMTTSRRREWTQGWERKDEKGTGTQIDPQTEELADEYMGIK